MRFGCGIVVALVLSSCGLDTVSTLPAPNVSFLDQTMVTDTTLSLVHSASLYSGTTDFQGYQVYYKIYPGKTVDFSRLAADRDSVNLSPTVNQLMNLGYFQMTQSASGGPTPLSTPLVPLLINVADKVQVTLDFRQYATTLGVQSSNSTVQPLLEYNGSTDTITKPYLFRTSLLAGSPLVSFMTLTAWSSFSTTTVVDMAGQDSSGKSQYEINVFIVAYGLSPTLQAIYSPPVAWGVVRSPNSNQ